MASGVHLVQAVPEANEQTLTVAFLYNFLKFTEWPPNGLPDTLTLCIADNESLANELTGIEGKTVQDKKISIRLIELNDNPQACQLLFLPREEKPVRIRRWLKNTANSPILTVSNSQDFLDMGGMIVLLLDGDHLQFEVSLIQAKPAGISFSAQLLDIARNVRGK